MLLFHVKVIGSIHYAWMNLERKIKAIANHTNTILCACKVIDSHCIISSVLFFFA